MKNDTYKRFINKLKDRLTRVFRNINISARSHPTTWKTAYSISFFLLLIFLLHILIILAPALQQCVISLLPDKRINVLTGEKDPDKYLKELKRDNLLLEGKLFRKIPAGSYLVINTTKNHFKLYHNRKVKREGFCSTGSYIHLEADDSLKWIFKTPKGMFRIRWKTEYPVWKKPDWAFIEEGLPVPPRDDSRRFEYGVLGDYALSLGDGYLIHGTLYKRQLGMPVTHGCIRLGDDDLEAVYKNLQVGSNVFIY